MIIPFARSTIQIQATGPHLLIRVGNTWSYLDEP